MPKRPRLVLLLTIGLVLAAVGWSVRYFWLLLPVGEGPAGPVVPREPFEQVWSERRVLLLGFGDSITAGLGAARSDRSYFQRLAANPLDEYADMRGICLSAVYPNLETRNLAISGTNSLQHLDVLDNFPVQDEEIFGLVVMTTGGNDLIHWYGRSKPRDGAMYGAPLEEARPWVQAFADRLEQMIVLLEERFPGGCEIFLGDIYDPSDGVGDAAKVFLPPWPDALRIHAEYNRVLRECADRHENVHLVPIYRTFLGHGFHCTQFWNPHYRREDPHYWYYENVEDPNDRGHDALRRIYALKILEVLGPQRQPTAR